MSTIAVIQPYFVPYAGYFRLFAGADTVVMFDCVQFPRRGWVHRNRFDTESAEQDWWTLPLAKGPRELTIRELRFLSDARVRLIAALARFPVLRHAHAQRDSLLERVIDVPDGGDACEYLIALVRAIAAALGFERPIVRSSSLDIDPELHAQSRVIAIAKALNASTYVNPSGGRELYDRATFGDSGLDLRFLTPYSGSFQSVLTRLLTESADKISEEITRETQLVA